MNLYFITEGPSIDVACFLLEKKVPGNGQVVVENCPEIELGKAAKIQIDGTSFKVNLRRTHQGQFVASTMISGNAFCKNKLV